LPSPTEQPVHGGLLDAELAALGLRPHDVLDVSVNVNPYGPTAAVVEAIRSAPIDRYPDPTAWRARLAIAQSIGATPERIVLGNGAVDLIWTLVRARLPAGRSAVIVEPAFSEFRAAVGAAGGRIVTWRALPEAGFAVDLAAVAHAIRSCDAALVYLSNPANPTGVLVDTTAISRFARGVPSALVVLDESFLELSDGADDERQSMPDNVIRVRSMTKTHALAGVRVGYLVAREDIAASVERARPPWTSNAMAQAAACAAARERAFVDTSRARVLFDRDRVSRAARGIGLAPLTSSTLFFLIPVRDARAARAELLAKHRVLVRDATSFGLPGFIRVCSRPAADDDRLLRALSDEVLR
jgi:histidinol-phosphate/aromatic aminotransferase/cobyric acid decarboxylase-like protein